MRASLNVRWHSSSSKVVEVKDVTVSLSTSTISCLDRLMTSAANDTPVTEGEGLDGSQCKLLEFDVRRHSQNKCELHGQ